MSGTSRLVALIFEEEVRKVQSLPLSAQQGTEVGQVVVGESPDKALAGWREIRQKAKDADVELEDAVLIYKTTDGQTEIRQFKELTGGKGAARGAFWGLLAGLIFGGPVAGVLWGLGIGAVYGKAVDHGIDNKFLRDAGRALRPAHSAILMLIQDQDYEGAMAYLKTFDARIYESEFSQEAEKATQKAAENPEIARAVEAEFQVE